MSSCPPLDPEIARLVTSPPDQLNLSDKNQPVALRRSKRTTAPPDILTYTDDTPTVKKNQNRVKKIVDQVEKTKKGTSKKSRNSKQDKPRDPNRRPNPWAMRQAWLNKLRIKRQDPEYIKAQQAIVAKYRHEYIPYKWVTSLSTYENLYRSELLKKYNQQGSHPSHTELVSAIDHHIKVSLPMTTTPLSLSLTSDQLQILKREQDSMTLDKAVATIKRLETVDYMEIMQALRVIENIPSDMAVATHVSASRAKSIPLVEPKFVIPRNINDRVMKKVEATLQEKYGKDFDVSSLADPKYKDRFPVVNPECSADAISDGLTMDLESDILTDRDIEIFDRLIRRHVMKQHQITNPDDPRLESLIEKHLRTLPELADSDFTDTSPSNFITDEEDIVTEIERRMGDLSLSSSKSPRSNATKKRRLGEGIRETRRRIKKYFKKRGSKKRDSNKPKSRKKRKQGGGANCPPPQTKVGSYCAL